MPLNIMRRPGTEIGDNYESPADYLGRNRIISLQGAIFGPPHRLDATNPAAVYNTILALAREDVVKPIYLFIDSPGGDVDTGFQLYDLIRMLPTPIITIGQSCQSMATVILAGGSKRYLLPNSRVMLHLPKMSGGGGDSKDMKAQAVEIKRVQNAIINAYVECGVHRDAKKIALDLERDNWMSATEALEYGLVDGIMTQEFMREILSNF